MGSRIQLIIVLLICSIQQVSATVTIGLNFVGGRSSPGGSGTTYLNASDTAGASGYNQQNWNNFASTNGSLNDLTDSFGNTTDIDVTVSGVANTWSITTTAAASMTADGRLMNGYLDTNTTSTSTIALSNIPFLQYDVVLYFDGDGTGRSGDYTVGGTTRTALADNANFPVTTGGDGNFTFANASSTTGNVSLFTGYTSSSVTITAQANNFRGPLNGVQIAATGFVWDAGNANGNWSEGGNWDTGSVPNATDAIVLFDDTGNAELTVDVPGTATTVGQLIIDDNNYTIQSNTLDFNVSSGNASILVSGTAPTPTISSTLDLNDDIDIRIYAGTTTISGIIQETGGARALNKEEGGRLVLGGASTYSGATTINDGTLEIEHVDALGDSGTTTTTVTDGTTLAIDVAGTIDNENLSITGTGDSSAGAIDHLGAVSTTWSGNVTMAGASTIDISDASGSLNISGTLTGSTTLDKNGDGTLVLSADNNPSFTGQIEVNNGILTAAHGSALGDNTFGTTVFSGGTLGLSGGITLTENVGVFGTGEGGTQGAIWNDAGNNTMSGTLTLNSNSTVNTDAGTSLTTTGVISGGFDLTKNGDGTLTLAGAAANTFTGTTLVSDGNLVLDKDASGTNALAGAITISSGATLTLAEAEQISNTSDLTLSGGTFDVSGFNETLDNLTLTADSVIDFGSGGAIVDFTGTLNLSTYELSIYNWAGTTMTGGGSDQLIFSGDTLTSAELNQIRFYKDGGLTPWFSNTLSRNEQIAGGEVIPVPEPSTWFTIAGLLTLMGWRHWRFGRNRPR